MIVYNIFTGQIIAKTSHIHSVENLFYHESREFIDSLDILLLDEYPSDILKYRVVNGDILRIPEDELMEIQQFGKILSEEERFLEQLKPSYEEIQKAEETLKLLELLQEVM